MDKGINVAATVLVGNRTGCYTAGVLNKDMARKGVMGRRRRMQGDGDENRGFDKLPLFVLVGTIYLTSTFLLGHSWTRWCSSTAARGTMVGRCGIKIPGPRLVWCPWGPATPRQPTWRVLLRLDGGVCPPYGSTLLFGGDGAENGNGEPPAAFFAALLSKVEFMICIAVCGPEIYIAPPLPMALLFTKETFST